MGPSIIYVVSVGGEGVKNCRFWDEIVYGRPLMVLDLTIIFNCLDKLACFKVGILQNRKCFLACSLHAAGTIIISKPVVVFSSSNCFKSEIEQQGEVLYFTKKKNNLWDWNVSIGKYVYCVVIFMGVTKGQLISKCPFCVIVSTKTTTI